MVNKLILKQRLILIRLQDLCWGVPHPYLKAKNLNIPLNYLTLKHIEKSYANIVYLAKSISFTHGQ